jgi:hypothetical protein
MMLPAISNIATTFQLDPFLGTNQGDLLKRNWDTSTRISKLIKVAFTVLTVILGVGVFLDESKNRIFNALVAMALFYGIGYVIRKIYEFLQMNPIKKKYVKKRHEYSLLVAKKMVEHFGGYFYAFGDGNFILYNQNLCLYVNAEGGEWVGFNAASIKKVELEHVHLGTTTTSTTRSGGVGVAWSSSFGTYTGSSSTVSETTSHYEWRFDIFSSFIDYPNLTVVFPDNKEGEDFAKKAKAILTP